MADWEETALTEEDRIIGEAHTRWESCNTWYSISQRNWLDDWKFGNADSVNGYQWPNVVRTARIKEQRPVLTINKTKQHCMQIINSIRRNLPEIKARPTGSGASFESAKVVRALTRHIMYQSKNEAHIQRALNFQVFSGVGYFRVRTDYVDEGSWEQDITIEAIPDPIAVYMDLDARQPDKSDARYALIFTDINRKEFERQYPRYKQYAGQDAIAQANSWITHENVRIAEYFRKIEKKDRLYRVVNEQGQQQNMKRSQLRELGANAVVEGLEASIKSGDPSVQYRDTTNTKIEYYFIVGKKIVAEETTEWPGKWIPIVPVIGQEFTVEGVYDVKGQVRDLYDPQRMYNYWASAATEFGALQSKTPYIAPDQAIEEYEAMWNTANVTNHSVLIYKQYNDDGQELAAPQRQEPPQSAPAAIQGMQIAASEFAMVSGQVLPEAGPKAQTRSATAVDEQAETDDDSTYHYRANLGMALMQVGRIILDLLPKIYDTPRALMAMADDGSTYEVLVNPTMQQATQVEKAADANAVQKVLLNPNVGKYEIEIDAGPSWGTRRQEAFKALSVLLAENPALTTIIGDLMLQASDFHLSEEAAMRLRRMVPPQALGTGPSMQEQALQQQLAKMTDLLSKTMEQNAMLQIKGKAREEAREIDVFNAFTQRLKVVLDAALKAAEPPTPDQIRAIIDKAIEEAMTESMESTQQSTEEALTPGMALGGAPMNPLAGQPPMTGMRQGAEGGWYMRNFAQSPQYRRVS
jgi:hypothetical protein